MMKLMAFGTGLALGYVLGSKAGQQRYDQIVATVRGVGERTGVLPPAQRPYGTSAAQRPETLGDLAATAAASVADPSTPPAAATTPGS